VSPQCRQTINNQIQDFLKRFRKELKTIYELRNALAHSNATIEYQDGAEQKRIDDECHFCFDIKASVNAYLFVTYKYAPQLKLFFEKQAEPDMTPCMAVEVRIPSSSENIPISSTERPFKHKLLELGLLTEIKKPLSKKMGDGEQPLAQVQGKPLSQLIIEERR
jgi:hypothetical protein